MPGLDGCCRLAAAVQLTSFLTISCSERAGRTRFTRAACTSAAAAALAALAPSSAPSSAAVYSKAG